MELGSRTLREVEEAALWYLFCEPDGPDELFSLLCAEEFLEPDLRDIAAIAEEMYSLYSVANRSMVSRSWGLLDQASDLSRGAMNRFVRRLEGDPRFGPFVPVEGEIEEYASLIRSKGIPQQQESL